MTRSYRSLLFIALSLLGLQLRAANRFWISPTPSNWNNTANWATTSGGAGGASVPGAADNVTFDNNGIGNCTIDIAVDINKITVAASYTGTISQGGNTFATVGTASFSGGGFSGGTANITFGGNFTLSGAAFTSTAAVLEFDGNSAFTSGTFSHNNGTVRYNASGATTISGTSPAFYDLEFVGEGFAYNMTSTGNIAVGGSLALSGTLTYNLNTATLDVAGDINVTNTAIGCAGSALIDLDGAGTQNFNGAAVAGEGALPQVTIDKPSGTLNLTGYPTSSNAFTYTAGTVSAGTSAWCFTNGNSTPYTISGSLTFNNIMFMAAANVTFTIAAGSTLTTSDLTLAGTNKITLNTGNIDVNGDIILTNTSAAGGGTALITVMGAGNETIDGTAISTSQSLLPLVTINKAGGTLTLKGNISESRSWTYTAGTVDATTFSSTVVFGGNGLNLTSNGMTFYNIIVSGNTITLQNNLTVAGNLTINAGKIAAGANTINLAGNWSDYGTAGFTEATSTVDLDGAALQTITTPGGENFTNLTVDNTGAGIQLINNVTVATTLTMTTGNIDLNANTLTLGLSVANNGTLSYANGTIINTGTFTRWYKAAAIAGTTGLFPVGTAANYRPFIVTSTANPTTGGTISMTYTDATTNSAVAFLDGASLVGIRKDLNWTLSTGNGLAGGTYSLQAQGTGFGTISSVADLRLTLAGSVVATAGVNGGTTSDPQVNRTGLSLANLSNTFYIGSVDPGFTTLPVRLLYFKGILAGGSVDLYWAADLVQEGDWFILQRSADGALWEDLQKVAASGLASGPGAAGSADGNGASGAVTGGDAADSATRYYSAIDASPYPGKSFYRLREEDADGNSTYSSILSFEPAVSAGRISVSPVPATDHLTISFPATGAFTITLFNSIGRPVREPLSSAGSSLTLPVSGLAAGVYFIRIVHDGMTETREVFIR